MKKIAIWAIILTMLVGCSRNDESIKPNTNPSNKQTEFFASVPDTDDSRTYVEDNKHLRWNANDEITIFNGNSYNSHWQFIGTEGANCGKFTEVEESGFVTGTPLDLTAHYAIYPYDENITITEAGIVSLTLPAIQPYNHSYTNSFGRGANTMMAVTKNTSDNFLAFRNLCGYLKLKLYGDNITVKNITVKGNNGEKIAGNATVSMVYGSAPTVTIGANATETITIDCGEGVTLSNDSENPTIFWVAIPEITFEEGITIEVTDINGQNYTKRTSNKVPIKNNSIQPMATLHLAKQSTNNPDSKDVIYANDIETMHAFTADFVKLESNTWPWQGAWASIPNAYKLTYRDNNSGDDLIFAKPFSRYEIYGFDGAYSSIYNLSTCWIIIEKSAAYKGLTNGYKIRMRLGNNPAEGLYPNTHAGWDGENEATIVFYDENNVAYALIYCIQDPNYIYYPETSGEVKFTDPAIAESYGATLEKIVEGDEHFDAVDAAMGVLQYRLTHTSPMSYMATLQIPSYYLALCYPSDSWLSIKYSNSSTTVAMAPEENQEQGHILFYDSSWSVLVRLVCIYNAAQ